MKPEERIDLLIQLGKYMKSYRSEELLPLFQQAINHNQWFTLESIQQSWDSHISMLEPEILNKWVAPYHLKDSNNQKIGIIMAGNIPLVGLHDLFCVMVCGKKAQIKLSSQDEILIPRIIQLLNELSPELANHLEIVDKLTSYDAVIATGSNNTAQNFEHYFKHVPNLIRRNRNGIAIISGNESREEIKNLGHDIFDYFGMGCRNISKIYLPEHYNIAHFYEPLEEYSSIINHNKYANNYTYQKALFLMNLVKIYDNGFLILLENPAIPSPTGILNFEYYHSIDDVENDLISKQNQIQCIVSQQKLKTLKTFPFGEAQNPKPWDYADGVDTVEWLLQLL